MWIQDKVIEDDPSTRIAHYKFVGRSETLTSQFLSFFFHYDVVARSIASLQHYKSRDLIDDEPASK